MEPTRETKLESYRLIAKIFTKTGDLATVITACDLGLSLNPLCGELKFFKGVAFYRMGIHDKSTKIFNDIIYGNNIIHDDKLKLLFQENNIPHDGFFMQSLNKVYSKMRMKKILNFSPLLIVIVFIGILCFKMFG